MTTAEEHLVTRKDLTKFVSQHAAWKIRLDKAIHEHDAALQPADIQREDLCEFGKWLQVVEATHQGSAVYDEARARHVAFHQSAATVATLIQNGHQDEAEQALDLNGQFFKASAELTLAMMAWKKTLPE